MKKLSPSQINAADEIIKDGTDGGTISPFRLFGRSNDNGWGWKINDITDAAAFLKAHDFIKFEVSKDGNEYRLTGNGLRFKEEGKSIRDFFQEEAEKDAKQLAKDERDEHYKNLQVQDLEEKLNIMNVEQKDFWKAQKQKNLQTSLIAIISALFSLIALLKTWGFFD